MGLSGMPKVIEAERVYLETRRLGGSAEMAFEAALDTGYRLSDAKVKRLEYEQPWLKESPHRG